VRELLFQLTRFASVGLIATGVHALSYASFSAIGIDPLLSNLFAFLIAFSISFIGHFKWTFKNAVGDQNIHTAWRAQIKFLVVALTGLSLNSLSVLVITDWLDAHYLLAILPMVFVVPLITFGLSKVWVFH